MRSKTAEIFLSVFDLDLTLLKVNSSYRFGAYLYRHKKLSFLSMLQAVSLYGWHKLGLLSLQVLHEKLFQLLFKGRKAFEIDSLAAQFVAEEMDGLWYEPALNRLKEAQQKGHYTLLLSSSPDFLIGPLAKLLKVDGWASTPYLIDATSSCFLALGKVMHGEEKKRSVLGLMEEFEIGHESVYAYSDSHLDLPLLEMAGHPIAVAPSRRLRAICRRRKWQMI